MAEQTCTLHVCTHTHIVTEHKRVDPGGEGYQPYGCALCVLGPPSPPPPPNGIPPQIQGPEASRPGGPPRQACRTPYRTPLGAHTKEWNGGLAEERVRRENAIHTQTRGVCVCVCLCVCVCVSVCLSQTKRENLPQKGGWEIEWPYIHKDIVCVCVCIWQKGKPSCSTGGGGAGFSFFPGPHAQLENHKAAGVGGGDAAGSRAQNRGGGGRGCGRSRGISCSTGGCGENTP